MGAARAGTRELPPRSRNGAGRFAAPSSRASGEGQSYPADRALITSLPNRSQFCGPGVSWSPLEASSLDPVG